VADWSGQAWLQGFNDAGLAVFGMSANDLVQVKVCVCVDSVSVGHPNCFTQERDEAEYNVLMHKANCTAFNFACRAKQDTYNVIVSFCLLICAH
jgi:replication factor A1